MMISPSTAKLRSNLVLIVLATLLANPVFAAPALLSYQGQLIDRVWAPLDARSS